MLRNNPIGSILVTVFFLLALTTFWLASNYFFSVREAQSMQFRFQAIQGTMNSMQRLVSETIEYSRKNPDVDPILIKFNFKPPAPATPATPPPAVRPSR